MLVDSPDIDTNPTRTLCVGIHYNSRLRDRVVDAFLDEPHRAWAPVYCVDTTALLRHAVHARRWQVGRDAVACLLATGVPAVVIVRLLGRFGAATAATVAALVLVMTAVAWLLRWMGAGPPAIREWVVRRFKRRPFRTLTEGLFAVLTLMFLGWVLVRSPGAATDLAVVAGGLAAAYLLAFVDEHVTLTRAIRAAAGKTPLRDQAPVLPRMIEDRLTAMQDETTFGVHEPGEPTFGSVVCYDGTDDRRDTHVGSGQFIGDWPIHVDVTQGRLEDDGRRLVPKHVDVVDLHQWLEDALARAAVPGLWFGHRMYVDGSKPGKWARLMPDRYGPPPSRLAIGELYEALQHPRPYGRTYLCVQKAGAGWQGDLVVTLFVRAELIGTNLHLHNRISVLPRVVLPPAETPRTDTPRGRWRRAGREEDPLGLRADPLARPLRRPTLAVSLRKRRRRAAGAAVRNALPMLANAPFRLAVAASRPLSRWVQRWSVRRRIDREWSVNFGAGESIRERLALGQRLIHPDAMDDVVRDVSYLEDRLTKAFKEFLTQHDVDVSALDSTVQAMITNQYNTIENLVSKNVAFGSHASAGDNTKHSPQQPPPAKGPAGG